LSTIRLVGVDLFFRAKIDAMLGREGHTVTTRADAAPDLVIADVNRADPVDVLAEHPGVPVLGFGAHTDPQALRDARAAGFAAAVPRSVVAERLPELVRELASGPAG
jgi:DNA-binding NarL/FixJ family response regulator